MASNGLVKDRVLRIRHRLRWGMALSILVIAIVTVVAVGTACTCESISYTPVDLANVPAAYLAEFKRLAPGIVPQKAWRFDSGDGSHPGDGGYLVRGGSRGMRSRDLPISDTRVSRDPDPRVLEPAGTP